MVKIQNEKPMQYASIQLGLNRNNILFKKNIQLKIKFKRVVITYKLYKKYS